MTQEKFQKIIDDRLQFTKNLLLIKGKEYVRNNDPLHNFNKGSEITSKHKAEVLDGMMLKHYISYRDLLKDISEYKFIKLDQVKEKIGDLIVYLCIQETIFEEYCNNQALKELTEELENI